MKKARVSKNKYANPEDTLMTKYILQLLSSTEDHLKIHQPDNGIRAQMHEVMRNIPEYVLQTIYRANGVEVKCDGCGTWLQEFNNACCGNEAACTSLIRQADCANCNCTTIFDLEEIDTPSYIDSLWGRARRTCWSSTGQMLLRKKGVPYRHLLRNGDSFRRKYRTKAK